MDQIKNKADLKKLFRFLVTRGEAEYDYGLNPTPKNQGMLKEAKKTLEISASDLNVYPNSEEFYNWLKKRGFIFWTGPSCLPNYSQENYLLGKIQQNGKRETPNGTKYNWYIIETETPDFMGLETVENYAQRYGNNMATLNFVSFGKDTIGNKTGLKTEYEDWWWLFSKKDYEEDEECLRESFGYLMEYKFVRQHMEKAKQKFSDPNSTFFHDGKATKDFFVNLCAQEVLELNLLYDPSIFWDAESHTKPESWKKAFINQLVSFPSYHTLSWMANTNPNLPAYKAAQEIFEMLKKRGYDKERLAKTGLQKIQKITNNL